MHPEIAWYDDLELRAFADTDPPSLWIIGNLDAFSASAIEPELRAAVEQHRRLELNLSGVRVLTSGGLTALERLRDYACEIGVQIRVTVKEGSVSERVLAKADFGG